MGGSKRPIGALGASGPPCVVQVDGVGGMRLRGGVEALKCGVHVLIVGVTERPGQRATMERITCQYKLGASNFTARSAPGTLRMLPKLTAALIRTCKIRQVLI